jgi:hypothetical protein
MEAAFAASVVPQNIDDGSVHLVVRIFEPYTLDDLERERRDLERLGF